MNRPSLVVAVAVAVVVLLLLLLVIRIGRIGGSGGVRVNTSLLIMMTVPVAMVKLLLF